MARQRKALPDRDRSRSGSAKSGNIAPAPVEQSRTGGSPWIFAAIATCFVLSGLAGLLYQTVWARSYSLVLGTSENAIAVVLAAFMGGLAIGAATAARLADRVRRPVLAFGLLELGVALTGLSLPLLLDWAAALYVAGLGGAPDPVSATGIGQMLYRIALSAALLVPTAFMGATLPLLTRYAVRRDVQVAPRVAALYAANTAGAVGGALLGGFALLPALGLYGTLGVAAAVNAVVFVLAAMLARLAPTMDTVRDSAPHVPEEPLPDSRQHWILPLMCVSGAVSLAYEVLWTRLLSHILGSSIMAFATMLASFLTGIALGTAAAAWVRTRHQARLVFPAVQAGIAVTSAVSYLWLQGLTTSDLLSHRQLFAVLMMLPATFFIGATFPLAVRILTTGASGAATSTGRVYAWNTMGAIIGALAAGFWVVPTLEFHGTSRLLVAVSLMLAVAAFILIVQPKPMRGLAAAVLATGGVFVYRPGLPLGVIDASLVDEPTQGEIRFHAVGRSATVLMIEGSDGYFHLRTNGLPEATITRRGAPLLHHSQRWLTALPLATRPEARDVLVIGLGGGVAVESLPERVRRIDVIELEPQVVAANRAIGALRAADPLADPRVHVIVNDARNALALTSRRYDVLVSQPSHPWTAGASHLYTQEFLELAREHLTPEGVFVQWINTQFVDEPLLKSLMATLLGVFPHVRLYQPEPMELMFLASSAPLDAERLAFEPRSPIAREAAYFGRLGIRTPEDLVTALAAAEPGLASLATGASSISDSRNLMATHSGPDQHGMSSGETARVLLVADPLLAEDRNLAESLRARLDIGYLGTRLVVLGLDTRARALSDELEGQGMAWLIRAAGLAANGEFDAAERARRRALKLSPTEPAIVFALVRNHLAALAAGDAPPEIRVLATRLPDSGDAVVEGWGMAGRGAWRKLEAIEAQLAAAKPTDAWRSEAAQLRAEWRTKVSGSEQNHRLAIEALALTDLELASQPSGDAFVIRAAAALELRDPELFIESASAFATYQTTLLERITRKGGTLSPEARRVLETRLRGFSSALGEPFIARLAGRAGQVREQLERLAAELGQLR
jgi:spermidine synthase